MLFVTFLVAVLSSVCFCFFFFNDTATTEIYTLSLHDALPIVERAHPPRGLGTVGCQLGGEVVIRAATQTALLVHDHDDFLGPELALRNRQRADRVVGDEAAGIADDVRIAALDAKQRIEL